MLQGFISDCLSAVGMLEQNIGACQFRLNQGAGSGAPSSDESHKRAGVPALMGDYLA